MKLLGKFVIFSGTAVLFFTFILVTVSTLAKEERKPSAAPTNFQYTLTSQEWTRQMLQELPVAFCDTREYFGSCFDVDKHNCQKTVSLLAKACLKGMEVPKNVRLSTVGLKLGHQLGSCIGSQYERNMIRKKKKDPYCQEIRQWL